MSGLFKDVLAAVNPFAYRELRQRSMRQSMWFVIKLLFASWIVALLLFIPQIATLQSYFVDQFSRIDEANIHGNLTMSAPILIPEKHPFLIIDTTGAYKRITGGEFLLVTNDYINYRSLGPIRKVNTIELSAMSDMTRMRNEYGELFAMLAVALMPAFIFWSFAILLLKYVFVALAMSTIAWVLLDLTMWKQGFGRIASLSFYALVAAIPIEVVLLPFDPNWLVPVAKILYLKIYLVPLILYAVLFAAALGMSAGHHESGHRIHRSANIEWGHEKL